MPQPVGSRAGRRSWQVAARASADVADFAGMGVVSRCAEHGSAILVGPAESIGVAAKQWSQTGTLALELVTFHIRRWLSRTANGLRRGRGGPGGSLAGSPCR